MPTKTHFLLFIAGEYNLPCGGHTLLIIGTSHYINNQDFTDAPPQAFSFIFIQRIY
ncbi:MAG: hypothetical protein ACTSRZ_03910 [Promethearchaeota archaeon]